MQTFKSFITEGVGWAQIAETPQKESILDVFLRAQRTRTHKQGTTSKPSFEDNPDEMADYKHLKFTYGRSSPSEGWAAEYPSLESIPNFPAKSIKAHQDAIDRVNSVLTRAGHSPMQVTSVHVVHPTFRQPDNPFYQIPEDKTLANRPHIHVHLNNGEHDMHMSYRPELMEGSRTFHVEGQKRLKDTDIKPEMFGEPKTKYVTQGDPDLDKLKSGKMTMAGAARILKMGTASHEFVQHALDKFAVPNPKETSNYSDRFNRDQLLAYAVKNASPEQQNRIYDIATASMKETKQKHHPAHLALAIRGDSGMKLRLKQLYKPTMDKKYANVMDHLLLDVPLPSKHWGGSLIRHL